MFDLKINGEKAESGIKGEKGAVMDDEHMENTEAETDIQHVIGSDRPAHPSRFFGVEI